MSGVYDAGQRRELERALKEGAPLRCPVCGHGLSEQKVAPPAEVAYVRRRVWVVCPGCRRTASIEGAR